MADVPLRDYTDAINAQRDRTMIVGALGIIACFCVAFWGVHEATRIALDAANDKGAAHNGLIERMRELASTYVTKTTVFLALGAILGWGTLAWTVLSPLLLN